LKTKCDNLGRGVSTLEDKCNNLSVTVDNLNIQLERSVKNEADVQDKVSILNRNVNASYSSSNDAQDRVAQLERSLAKTNNEKQSFEEQLDESRQSTNEMKRRIDALEDQLSDAQAVLQKSESRANQLELSLQTSRANHENNSTDNYIRDELGRLRRENDQLQDRLRDMTRKLTMLEDDKRDLEKRVVLSTPQSKSRSMLASPVSGYNEQVDHVRTQIPLMSGGQRTPTPGSHHHAHAGSNENLVKIRILEQENERFLRKIRGLEQQLSELESLHGSRIQELLQERRKEREKENQRQRESVRQVETSQLAREKIFKERINGLEQQVDVLKDQLSKEMRRRQTLISESSGIANEITELRHNLDQSLQNVFAATDGRTLDREASRLNKSVDRYGSDYTSRLTPSKLNESHRKASASVDNLSNHRRSTASTSNPSFSSSKIRRTLHFGEDL
jgi:chromosome segregation ATPase